MAFHPWSSAALHHSPNITFQIKAATNPPLFYPLLVPCPCCLLLTFSPDKASDTHHGFSVFALMYTINALDDHLPSRRNTSIISGLPPSLPTSVHPKSSPNTVEMYPGPVATSRPFLLSPTPCPLPTAHGVSNGLLGTAPSTYVTLVRHQG